MTSNTHGTWDCYGAGCRCAPCTAAATAHQSRYRQRKSANGLRRVGGRWVTQEEYAVILAERKERRDRRTKLLDGERMPYPEGYFSMSEEQAFRKRTK